MMGRIIWQVIKKWGRRLSIVIGVLYALALIDLNWPRHPTCPVEEHTFKGQKFDIEICSGYGSERGYIGILVYSKEGDFLAWRRGNFAKESRLNYMAIEDTMIRYSDSPMDRINPPADCVLNMPPTWVDWLEARLPGGIPGVHHCGIASDDVVDRAQEQWEAREKAERKKEEAAIHERNARPQAAPSTSAPPK